MIFIALIVEFTAISVSGDFILPDVGHGFSKWSDFMPQWKDANNRLNEKYDQSKLVQNDDDLLKKLPLSVINAKIQNKEAPVVLFISGDGGWYRFEQSIADDLANFGIPTIGLDSKKYFWNRKSPEETARDMAKVLDYFAKKWERKRFILIGYSFGSEIVPFIVNRLPEPIKSEVEASVLLSPTTDTDFEIHLSNMLGVDNRQKTFNVIDEIRKEQSGNVLIIYGKDKKSPVPGLVKGTAVRIMYIPGDHHYQYNHSLIVQTMKANKVL